MLLWLCFSPVMVPAHSQRLSSIQSMLKQTGRYRTLERDLMDLQERKLFEYFLVVALHKTKAGAPYLPEVTQQFPLKVNTKHRPSGAVLGRTDLTWFSRHGSGTLTIA